MSIKKRFTMLFLPILFWTMPILAQESTPESTESPAIEQAPAPIADEPLTLESFASSAAVVLLVYLFTEIAKRVPALAQFDPFKLAGLLSLILYLGYRFVFAFGGDAGAYMTYLADFGHIAESLYNVAITFVGVTGVYHSGKNMAKSLPKPIAGAKS